MSDLTEAQQDEYRSAAVPDKDSKGRPAVGFMSERELLEECVLMLRGFADALEQVGQNPMLKAMPGMGALFGRK